MVNFDEYNGKYQSLSYIKKSPIGRLCLRKRILMSYTQFTPTEDLRTNIYLSILFNFYQPTI